MAEVMGGENERPAEGTDGIKKSQKRATRGGNSVDELQRQG